MGSINSELNRIGWTTNPHGAEPVKLLRGDVPPYLRRLAGLPVCALPPS